MVRERGQEDCLLQLSETRTHHCRLLGDQKQTLNLQEALQKAGLESCLGLGERIQRKDGHG